jgi:hypothetical protein
VLIRQVADKAWFATVPHPMKPNGWDITWGDQVDPRVVRLTGGGQFTDVAVASYLAKYATKSTESVGVPLGRITAENFQQCRLVQGHRVLVSFRENHRRGLADHHTAAPPACAGTPSGTDYLHHWGRHRGCPERRRGSLWNP